MNRLAQLLKTNRTLGKLDVAFNPRLGAAETRQVCAMIRLYNDCLGSLAIGQLPMGDELASAVGKAVQASARAKARLPSPLFPQPGAHSMKYCPHRLGPIAVFPSRTALVFSIDATRS